MKYKPEKIVESETKKDNEYEEQLRNRREIPLSCYDRKRLKNLETDLEVHHLVTHWSLWEKLKLLARVMWGVYWVQLKDQRGKIGHYLTFWRRYQPIPETQWHTSRSMRIVRMQFPELEAWVYPLVILGNFALLFLLGWLVALMLSLGSAPKLADPSIQLEIPQVVEQPAERVPIDPWVNYPWLSIKEARQLRTQLNVIHLAYLKDGSAFYSGTQSTFLNTKAWVRAKSFIITALSQKGSQIVIEADGFQYHLNIYQPFVVASFPENMFIVDEEGLLWQAERQGIQLQSIESVQNTLPLQILSNQNLSLTFNQ